MQLRCSAYVVIGGCTRCPPLPPFDLALWAAPSPLPRFLSYTRVLSAFVPQNPYLDPRCAHFAAETKRALSLHGGQVPFDGLISARRDRPSPAWPQIGRKDGKDKAAEAERMTRYPNLTEPHRLASLAGKKIKVIASGPAACHSIIIGEEK